MKSLTQLFHEPEPKERPLRILVFGLSKVGKSHLVFTATDVGPLYWQDTESGADLYPSDHGFGFRVHKSKDAADFADAIKAASATVSPDNPKPIVALDSMSSTWQMQQDVAESLRGKHGRFGAWAPAKAPLKALYEAIHSCRCHVVITARDKSDYAVDDKGKPTETGHGPVVEKNLPYAVDLILRLDVNRMPGKVPSPEDFYAVVEGTRSPSVDGADPPLPIGTVLKNPQFKDLLSIMQEGAAPDAIKDTAGIQIARADPPKNWGQLQIRAKSLGLTGDIAALVKEKFGSFDPKQVGMYWEYLVTLGQE